MKKTLTTLWVLLVSIGIIFPNFYGSILSTVKFGATNYPASLDSLTNPNPTDSVATVSHSAQHSNANDAIEALQAKLGTGASTAVANSIFVGNGAGTSLFTTHATATAFTGTNLTSTGLSTFGQFLSLASSTIIGGLHIAGNSTTTNATSTIGAFTSFATSTKYFGANLSNCSGTNFLQWTSGSFGCGATASAFSTQYATATGQYIAKTFQMTPTQVAFIWASAQAGTTNNNFSLTRFAYKWATDLATTTLAADGDSANADYETFFHIIQASTTNTLTVELATTNADPDFNNIGAYIFSP